MSDVVTFRELNTASGHRFGIATLNAPESLNSLSLDMIRLLSPKLREWAKDSGIAGVVLNGSGEKAFCAGGDIRELYQSLKSATELPGEYAPSFFAEEYELDYLIHTYEKPFVCWGNGFVMGGGIGLMAGASHRVVTEKSRLAMPEVSIGLYPDVGGSWILRRMPGKVGLFLAITGAHLNASDAVFCGLADHILPSDSLDALLAGLESANWSNSSRTNKALLSSILSATPAPEVAESNVLKYLDLINKTVFEYSLSETAARLAAIDTSDKWLATAVSTFTKGSPSSAAVSFEIWNRVEHMSLADVFRMEYNLSLGFSSHKDFVEGVRALLIDKDKNPTWNPASISEVTDELVESHFLPRYADKHPLADLGK